MKKAAKPRTAHLFKYAGGRKTKKSIIRISRKNEINWFWACLISYQLILVLLPLIARSILFTLVALLTALTIVFIALLYQGFEVIQE